ncbi:type VII secretion system-associated protein [Streptomyces sp. NPDC002668]|uniref:type VII secretion system-associated protein n=1 Tax=Streptomyces sp. NPDC002668 TaxID=3154422 RepID=UPI0033226E49
MVGQWLTAAAGEIVEWRTNEEYWSSPRSLNLAEPTDAVDAAVQLVAIGYGQHAEDVPRALAAAEVAVIVPTDGRPVTAAWPHGLAVVPAITSRPTWRPPGSHRSAHSVA